MTISSTAKIALTVGALTAVGGGAAVLHLLDASGGGENDAWVTSTNLYQIFPAKFTSTGTIAAMTEKVSHLKNLGVKTVWLMPVFKAMSPHGYNTIDYRTVAPRYGTNQDLVRFVKAAHDVGIRVLLDLVINHTGSQNPWFIGSDAQRHDDWFIWANEDRGWADPWDNDSPQYGKTWFKDPRADLDRDHNGNAHDDDFFYCVFCDTQNGVAATDMPDLNWKRALQLIESGNPSPLFDEVEGIMRYWVDEVGVDGFRADAVRYLVENGRPSLNRDQPETHRVWQELRRRLNEISPSAVLVAEAPTETYEEMRGYYGSVDHKEFQGAFHFKYYGVLMDAIKSGWRRGSFFQDLYEIQSHLPYDTNEDRLIGQDFVFLSNHDRFTGDRVATQLGGDRARIKLAASVYLLLSGNPVTYYGEEYGMQNTGASGDDGIRGPMDWDEVNRQMGDPSSVYSHYRGLFRIRNYYDALRGGRSLVVPSKADGEGGFDGPSVESGRVSLMREYYGEKILVVTNLTGAAQNVRVDLGGAGLPAMAPGAEVTVLMGGGSNEAVTAGNLHGYPIGKLEPYCSRVLYLGAVPTQYPRPLARYETDSSPDDTVWTAAYFRGTPNNWGTTAMVKNSSGLWETTQPFGGDNPRFKISRSTDWTEAYPPSDRLIKDGPGNYLITFDDASKAITVAQVSGTGWDAAFFRGTPNNWGTTPMSKNSSGLWETTQPFGGDNPRFKISRATDWTEAYPPSDYLVKGEPGRYVITFDDANKAIVVSKAP